MVIHLESSFMVTVVASLIWIGVMIQMCLWWPSSSAPTLLVALGWKTRHRHILFSCLVLKHVLAPCLTQIISRKLQSCRLLRKQEGNWVYQTHTNINNVLILMGKSLAIVSFIPILHGFLNQPLVYKHPNHVICPQDRLNTVLSYIYLGECCTEEHGINV